MIKKCSPTMCVRIETSCTRKIVLKIIIWKLCWYYTNDPWLYIRFQLDTIIIICDVGRLFQNRFFFYSLKQIFLVLQHIFCQIIAEAIDNKDGIHTNCTLSKSFKFSSIHLCSKIFCKSVKQLRNNYFFLSN